MNKAIILVFGAALAGCQSVPEKNATAGAVEAEVRQPVAAPMVEKAVVEKKVEVAKAEPIKPPVVEAKPEPVVVLAQAGGESANAASSKPVQAVSAPKVSRKAMAMDSRMDKVVKLINSSSGARQVMSSDNPKAHEYHEKARALYDRALHAEDKAQASDLLNQAVKAMYTAIRSASPESVTAEKRKRDFDKLTRSVNTFMEQHERISEEKGASSEGKALRSQVSVLVAEANKTFKSGDTEKAQLLLRESFEMLRNSIESMRGGDTLVRSLNFATKKDEYDYELERFKSQRMLVEVLLAEKRKSSAYVAKQVDRYVAAAEEGRGKAEVEAGSGNYEAAIKYLEDGRKQIVRALRTGGIYVPG